ncbi:MAG: transporter, partial [Cohnella sp.]|nr:transporter [Cohnella sp.]
KIQQGFFRQLRMESYRSFLQANWDFFLRRRKSDFIHLLTSELARIAAGVNIFLQFISAVVFTLIQVGIAVWLSAKMTIFVILCGCILTIFARNFIKKARSLGGQTSELAQQYLAGITDQLNGIKDIKSNMMEQSSLSWYSRLTQRMVTEQIQYTKLKTSSQFLYKASSAVLIVSYIFMSLQLFQGQLQQLILITLIFSRLWPKIAGIESNMEQIASIMPSFQAFIQWREEADEARELNESHESYEHVTPIVLREGLECRDIYFRYNRNEESYTLENIILFIPSTRMTAIVGRSGAGKSTLIDIVMGLIQPDKGEILIDGESLTKENLPALRRSIGYVSQDPFLFHASIRENLQMFKLDADDAQIWEALKNASAAEFVKRLPHGLDTLIGDRGIRLSGGERQRLVLSRAILRKPSILVLDEATSALDTENESIIQETLGRLKETITIIVIAHRLSTIRNADHVVVLDQGKIIQSGGFSQLANEKKGLFRSLLGKQLEGNLQADTVS